MKKSNTGLKSYLATIRKDADLGQAFVRIPLAFAVLLYLLFVYFLQPESVLSDTLVLSVSAAYFIFSVLIVIWNYVHPRIYPPRRYVSMLVDAGVVTYALVAGGAITAPVVGGYLWVTMANGLRFGRKYLYITNVACLLGFLYVLLVSNYWQQNFPLAIGLFIWLAILPWYVARLLVRLERAVENAERANTSKSQFLANMSHELRTPLNAIIGYGEMLVEDAVADDRKQDVRDLNKIQAAASQLLGMINEILDFSKIEAGRMEVHNDEVLVNDLIEGVDASVRPLARKNNNHFVINNHLADDAMMIVDVSKLRQVLINLLSNANKFTSNGKVSIDIKQHAIGGEDYIAFTVTDTGIGMTLEQCDRLFEPFVQADESTTRKYGGTGLGLAISKRFVELMNGTIDVHSEIGQGTGFTVSLPKLPCMELDEDKLMSKGVEVVNNLKRINDRLQEDDRRKYVSTVLVIDDDEQVREIISRHLEKEGFNIILAANGMEGLRAARDNRPDVITLDVMMPGMDGWTVLRTLKKDPELADIPVIMISMVNNAQAGFALGAADYMLKPIERKRLDDVIKKWVRQKAKAPVMIIDDDWDIRTAMRTILESQGIRVIEAADGLEGLQKMAEVMPSLIFLDMVMPVMSGMEFMQELQSIPEGADIPVIALTGAELEDQELTEMHSTFKEVLRKGDYNLPGLMQEVSGLMDKYHLSKGG